MKFGSLQSMPLASPNPVNRPKPLLPSVSSSTVSNIHPIISVLVPTSYQGKNNIYKVSVDLTTVLLYWQTSKRDVVCYKLCWLLLVPQ